MKTMKKNAAWMFGHERTAGGSFARTASLGALLILSAMALPQRAVADENGISFWLPGTFGSLAAAPGQPGLAGAIVYYHTSVSAGADVSRSREITLGGTGAIATANLNANLNATGDLALFVPSYTFATPVLGGQASVALTALYGRASTSVAGTLLAGVGGVNIQRSGQISDSLTGVGDLYPEATLKWNAGVHNFMVYAKGDIPVGDYSANRLSNLGIGHGAVDGGAGYTYFNPATGREFSAVGGLTYNLRNTITNYRNGTNFHLDLAAAQFLSKQFFVGAVGYFYQQLTDDSGALVGGLIQSTNGFRSRVAGIGPQIGYLFPVGNMQGYLNLKGYKEFEAQNRPEGWNAWLTFSLSPAAPAPPVPRSNLVLK